MKATYVVHSCEAHTVPVEVDVEGVKAIAQVPRVTLELLPEAGGKTLTFEVPPDTLPKGLKAGDSVVVKIERGS